MTKCYVIIVVNLVISKRNILNLLVTQHNGKTAELASDAMKLGILG